MSSSKSSRSRSRERLALDKWLKKLMIMEDEKEAHSPKSPLPMLQSDIPASFPSVPSLCPSLWMGACPETGDTALQQIENEGTLNERSDVAVEEFLQELEMLKEVETNEKTKVMKDKKEIHKPKLPVEVVMVESDLPDSCPSAPSLWLGACPKNPDTALQQIENEAKNLDDAMESLEKERKEAGKKTKTDLRITELQEKLREQEGKLRASEEKCAQLTEENMRLKTDLEMKKHISSFVVSGACWQYEMDGSWHALPPKGNEQMQEAYLAYLQDLPDSRHATISSGGVARTVDFELMKQKHLATQKVRRIRILPNVPAQWVSTPAELFQQGDDLRSFYKEVADKEILDSIHRILQETGHAQTAWGHWGHSGLSSCSCMRAAKIKSVHHIENFRLWHRYKTRLGAMRQDHAAYKVVIGSTPLDLDGSKRIMEEAQSLFHCGEVLDPDVDEKILLHGTSWENANSIVREGFDHRTCQNALYGAGVYFAGAACKSHQYTCENHRPKCCNCLSERTLIISRVALGDIYLATETRKKERRPPLRRESSGTYDSIMGKPGPIHGHSKTAQIHQEFVIFDREQAYPCYVVQYEV